MVFSVSALFLAAVVYADPVSMPNGAPLPVKTNDKLLIPPVVPERQDTVARGISETTFYHAPPIVKLEFFSSRAVDSSA